MLYTTFTSKSARAELSAVSGFLFSNARVISFTGKVRIEDLSVGRLTLDSIDDIAYDRLQCGTFSQGKYDSLILKNNRIRADLGKLQETCSMIDEGSEEVPSDLVYN
jgi:hypothetical protein